MLGVMDEPREEPIEESAGSAKDPDQILKSFFEVQLPRRRRAGRPPEMTDERKRAYLCRLAETGCVNLCAVEQGWWPQAVLEEQKADKDFNQACNVAIMLHNDKIDDSIRRRAIDGLAATRFHQGQWYTNSGVREYSDSLAALYAKRMNPAYRDKIQVEGLESSGVLVVPAKVTDLQTWAKQFEAAEEDEQSDSSSSSPQDPRDGCDA